MIVLAVDAGLAEIGPDSNLGESFSFDHYSEMSVICGCASGEIC